ncbi:HEAT repeat domain-containing protein [Pelagicoccus enzymogenes]|uniref:HEAT repeat domain-containing protein n=1 Tax=Pelagicoccus enzymogenes TaxID=2773457 RepID=UPI00280E3E74|nr:HEAT repeat domain-containing protein [Pelagicoccus enzymogenes]MDQ8200663.1 HEAT repeat domain-containing protein [Pelagicoccus enzymogenes]
MNFTAKLSLKPLSAALALLALPLSYGQIPAEDLDSIFSRLNGDDYDAQYDARMDLLAAVAEATAPGNEDQPKQVEAQLLQQLKKESKLTTQLWILRQLALVGSDSSIDTLEALLRSENRELVDGARMTLRVLTNDPNVEEAPQFSDKLDQLLQDLANAENPSIKAAIFEAIAEKSPKQAEAILLKSPLPEYIRVAATSGKRRLEKATQNLLGSGDVATQIVVLGALDGKIPSKLETQLIALLESENETLQLQTLEALGRVGSARSLDAVLALSDARSKDLSDAAIETLASIQDPRLDRNLMSAAQKGTTEDRVKALRAMSFRASEGISDLVNAIAANTDLDEALREEAIASMERVGNNDSLSVLVSIVLEEGKSGLRREAQKALKRMTLRTGDAEAAWAAFKAGLDAGDLEARQALILVADSAPSPQMVDYLMNAYESGDESIQKTVIRVLPSWRNWDGGKALLEIAQKAGSDEKLRAQCFKGIGRIILGSDENYSFDGKYELAGAALKAAKSEAERKAILDGFRYVVWKDKRYVSQNEVDPELKAAVENGQDK